MGERRVQHRNLDSDTGAVGRTWAGYGYSVLNEVVAAWVGQLQGEHYEVRSISEEKVLEENLYNLHETAYA